MDMVFIRHHCIYPLVVGDIQLHGALCSDRRQYIDLRRKSWIIKKE